MVVLRSKSSQAYASSASGRSAGLYTTMNMLESREGKASVSGKFFGFLAKKKPVSYGQAIAYISYILSAGEELSPTIVNDALPKTFSHVSNILNNRGHPKLKAKKTRVTRA